MFIVTYNKQYLRLVNNIYTLVNTQKNCTIFDNKTAAIKAAKQLNRFTNSHDCKIFKLTNLEILVWKEPAFLFLNY